MHSCVDEHLRLANVDIRAKVLEYVGVNYSQICILRLDTLTVVFFLGPDRIASTISNRRTVWLYFPIACPSLQACI